VVSARIPKMTRRRSQECPAQNGLFGSVWRSVPTTRSRRQRWLWSAGPDTQILSENPERIEAIILAATDQHGAANQRVETTGKPHASPESSARSCPIESYLFRDAS